jgi:hypothetical protein
MRAFFSFVDCSVQMFKRLFAMSVELALGVRQMLPGVSHRFDRFVHAWVWRRRWGSHRSRGAGWS